ncbi:MAG: hypothetical protein IAF08_01855 [Rhizobacter sp.]|nr:hypothetical protein [Chlorobiales bacterium]
MQKILFALLLTVAVAAVGCGKQGPTPEEVARMQADSIRMADSARNAVVVPDTAGAMMSDSTKMMDSSAMAPKTEGMKKEGH